MPRAALALFVALLAAAARTGSAAAKPNVFTAEQAASGKIEIANNKFGNCTDCHTRALTGRNGASTELPPLTSLSEDYQKLIKGNGGIVPPFVGRDFVAKWGPRSTQDLIKEFEDRFGKPLSTETRLNLIAYILQINGATPGAEALTPTTDIRIDRLLQN